MDCKNHTWKIKAPIYVNFRKHFCPQCSRPISVEEMKRLEGYPTSDID